MNITPTMNKLVEMQNISKHFPGVMALKNINFNILAGEVHVLLGENGAGKSTLMKILSGVYTPTAGKIILKGKSHDALTPKTSYENGIGIIYQELSLINELSVEENLFVGRLPGRKIAGIPLVDFKSVRQRANEVLQKVGFHKPPTTLVKHLSISEKQQAEIAKALVANADIIIMDEPTTSLTMEETRHLFAIINQLKREGKGIVYISHKLKEVKEIGDRVSVLKDGVYMGTRDIKQVEIEDLISMMVGRAVNLKCLSDNPQVLQNEVVFEVRNLTRQDNRVRNVSFQVHKGEILGFAGLIGSGRSELMNAIFGAASIKSGEIHLFGRRLTIKNQYQAIKQGFALVTENRRETGFFDNFSIKKNISIVPFIKNSRLQGTWGLLQPKAEERFAGTQRKRLNIKCSSINQNITELSGGNQQKVILGKWLAAESNLIIFDEPTKGIDIGSKSEIYALMRQLANQGKVVIMVSSELPELLSACDRIAVFREGQIVKFFANAEATEENIMRYSTGEASTNLA